METTTTTTAEAIHDWSAQLRHLIALDSGKDFVCFEMLRKFSDSFLISTESKDGGYAVVLLNHCFDSPALRFQENSTASLELPKIRQFIRLWNRAAVRHAVDGGTNYLFDLQQQQQQLLNSKESSGELLADPHLLTGDMDSVRAEVLNNYKQNPITEVIETPDQDETDFTKAIQVLARRLQAATTTASYPTKVSTIIVFYTGSTARLDHGLSIFSTLYRFGEDIDQGRLPRLVLVDLGSSISFLLTKVSGLGSIFPSFF